MRTGVTELEPLRRSTALPGVAFARHDRKTSSPPLPDPIRLTTATHTRGIAGPAAPPAS